MYICILFVALAGKLKGTFLSKASDTHFSHCSWISTEELSGSVMWLVCTLVFKVLSNCLQNGAILSPMAACELQEPWLLVSIRAAFQWSCANVCKCVAGLSCTVGICFSLWLAVGCLSAHSCPHLSAGRFSSNPLPLGMGNCDHDKCSPIDMAPVRPEVQALCSALCSAFRSHSHLLRTF